MKQKELLIPLYLKNGKAVCGLKNQTVYEDGDALRLAAAYDNTGADALLVFDLSSGDAEHDASIGLIKRIAQAVDVPLYGGGNIRRMEDVKKLIYAGCRKVFLNFSKEENVELAHEVSGRFGAEKIMACVGNRDELAAACAHDELLGGMVLLDKELATTWKEECASGREADDPSSSLYCMTDFFDVPQSYELLNTVGISGICASEFMASEYNIMEAKHSLLERGIPVNTYEASISWEKIKTNSDNMLPVVVQDYKTQEVLMVAYMNQEAFDMTVRTGRMTYWSRSRNELWVKGLTSGHFQYVKELRIDCDNDTLLAKVSQVGAACHTGNRSCFYRTIMKKEYDETNPLKVFEDVFHVILDRKEHPKEGSYTNYLFDKGIDKILKKVGEEATEIVIAAKNSDPEEIKYEISDFLYHVMVLMAQRGVSWEDITKELARR